jgi:hypothetical protein
VLPSGSTATRAAAASRSRRPRGELNAFSALRDSLYSLSVLNQYLPNYDHPNLMAFLGFALFSGGRGDGQRRKQRRPRRPHAPRRNDRLPMPPPLQQR